MDAKELISRGRTRLLSSHPFYGYMCMKLRLRVENNQPTMATDGTHLFFNEDFVKKQSKTQLVALLAHEVSHVYLKHPLRITDVIGCQNLHHDDGTVDEHTCYLQPAQVAADYAVNPRLKDGGFDLPPDAIYPEKQYWEDSLEGHYKRLKKSAKTIKVKCAGCSGVRAPKGKDGKSGLTPGERDRMEAELRKDMQQAYNFAKAAGKVPADLERMFAEIRAPKVSWQEVLRRFMQSISKQDYRMMPPNRRYIHQGLYLPSLRSETVGNVLLIIDGSGSTWNVFDQFISEFASIVTDVKPEMTHVMVWDTRCSWYRAFDNFSDESTQSIAKLKGEMGAGGGSVFTDCFEWFNEETGIVPQVAIVLTDMEIYWPEDPGYPVMWVASTNVEGPFGETVYIDAEERDE